MERKRIHILIKYGLSGIFIIGILASFAFSQDEVMSMNSEELGIHQRPNVAFPHEQHSQRMDCSRCHHDFDDFGVNKNSEGRKCSECHTKSSSKPIPLVKAFHLQCKGCHSKVDKTIKAKAPVMCGQCHVLKK